MKLFKLALALTAASVFAISCTDSTTTNGTNQSAGANKGAQTTPTPVPTPTATPDEFATIRATYSAACIRCHKPDGTGGTAELDEGKTLKVPSFKEGHALTHTDQQFARQIANGGDGMPAFKSRLTPEQINELVRFIRTEFQGRAAAAAAPTTNASPAASSNTAPATNK
jgi:mono/diheme cytochrome c family protein